MTFQRINRTRLLALLAFLIAVLAHGTSQAGDLLFFEGSMGPGIPYTITSPASDVTLDIDYSPLTAEGGGLYGFSEVKIVTTGDLRFTTASFSCQTFGCLWTPNPFVDGTSIMLSGAGSVAVSARPIFPNTW